MTPTRLLSALASVIVLAASSSARADGETAEGAPASPVPTTSPAAPTPPPHQGSTTVVAPPGSGGVTVVAPTAGGGSVTASGCSTVVVNGNPTLIGPGGMPCPAGGPAPYPNYAPYAGGPYAAPPPTMPYYDVRPKYAPDPDRKAAQIGASIGFGVGGGVAGHHVPRAVQRGAQSLQLRPLRAVLRRHVVVREGRQRLQRRGLARVAHHLRRDRHVPPEPPALRRRRHDPRPHLHGSPRRLGARPRPS